MFSVLGHCFVVHIISSPQHLRISLRSSVFLLILFASLCHAGWNFTARKAGGNLIAVWIGLWVGCLFLFPSTIAVVLLCGYEPVGVTAVICTIATGLIHAVYFRLLAAGYARGEISLVYPIARGSGIALTAILAWFFLQERFTFSGVGGIALVSLGIISISASVRRNPGDFKAIVLALGVGATIVAYSLVDKIGVRYVNPVIYIWAMFLISAIVLTPMVVSPKAIRRNGDNFFNKAGDQMMHALIIGVGSAATYLMILYAFTLEPVGYVVAVREFSVVVGALAGFVFLKERFTVGKIVSIGLIVAGIVCIKLS